MDTGLVRKIRHTDAQKEQDAAGRRRNLKGAFEITRRIDGMRILIIDDVYTTGRTMDEIAGCLKKAYSRYGNCYRIGGDEFCVPLREPEKEELCKEKFFWVMEKRRKVVSILPFVSYGSAELLEQESIRDTKARADQKMYEDKKEHKERKGR